MVLSNAISSSYLDRFELMRGIDEVASRFTTFFLVPFLRGLIGLSVAFVGTIVGIEEGSGGRRLGLSQSHAHVEQSWLQPRLVLDLQCM